LKAEDDGKNLLIGQNTGRLFRYDIDSERIQWMGVEMADSIKEIKILKSEAGAAQYIAVSETEVAVYEGANFEREIAKY